MVRRDDWLNKYRRVVYRSIDHFTFPDGVRVGKTWFGAPRAAAPGGQRRVRGSPPVSLGLFGGLPVVCQFVSLSGKDVAPRAAAPGILLLLLFPGLRPAASVAHYGHSAHSRELLQAGRGLLIMSESTFPRASSRDLRLAISVVVGVL